MALSAIPSNFGQGGVGLFGDNYRGSSLRDFLEEHRAAIETLQQSINLQIARLATTADHALSGLAAIDGQVPVAGNTILVKSQTSPDENGLYVAAAGAWTRLKDASGDDVIAAGMIVQVTEGSSGGDRQFFLSTDNPITVGTTNLTFTQIPSLLDLASNAPGKGASLISLADAGGYITATDAEGAFAEHAVAISPGIPMQNVLRLLGAPGAAVEGDTVTIGADVYEFRGSTPPAGGTAGRIWVYNGVDSAASRANLINAINGVVDAATITYDGAVTESFLAAAGITVGDILIQSADAVGGTPTPSSTATACTTTLGTATDIWDNATCQYGQLVASRAKAAVTVVVGAEELARGTADVVFPFTPAHASVVDRDRSHDEVVSITGNVVSVTLTGGADPNIQSADTLDFYAFE